MWYLQSITDVARRFSLVPSKDMVVGRKDCDILIAGDQSISRKHAIVHLTDGTPSVVHVTDCKSKFGTVINGKKLGAGQKMELRRNDVIKFGQGPTAVTSRFKLLHEPLVFCCSAISRQESSKVKQLARSLGAEVVSSWSERCSHLVMTTITVTVKVVSALSSCKPVVTPAWLEEAIRCRQSSQPLPSPSSFQPDVVDANVSSGAAEHGTVLSFAPNYNRTTLFHDCVFYFLSEKQHSRLKDCLQSAGALCQLISSPGSLALDTLVAKESVVLAVDSDLMRQATPTQTQWVEQVYSFLASHDLRAVQDSEIGFALLYISAKEYCNPRVTPNFPASSGPLAPPTLSQAPFTQPHSSHHHSFTHTHTHTLPFTQDIHQHTQDQTTILAPDSVDMSQSQTAKNRVKNGGNSGNGSVQRINETITSAKSSLEKSPLDVVAKTEDECSPSTADAVTSSTTVFKVPVNNKSPLKRDKRPPSVSKGTKIGNTTDMVAPKPASSAQPMGSASVGSRRGVSVKSESLDVLFGRMADTPTPAVAMDMGEKEGEGGEGGGRSIKAERQGEEERGRGVEVASPTTSAGSKRSKLKLKRAKTTQSPEDYTATRVEFRDGDTKGEGEDSSTVNPREMESPIVCDSQSDDSGMERNGDSILPGLRRPSVRTEQLRLSSQTSSQVPPISTTSTSNLQPTPSHPSSQSGSLTLPPLSQQEGSVIVPCSLTPRSQDKASGQRPSLPNSELLTFAFQGKRKKRSYKSASDDSTVETGEGTSKKQRVGEEGEESGGGGGRGEKEGARGGGMMDFETAGTERNAVRDADALKGSRNERGDGRQRVVSGAAAAGDAGLFSGLQSTRARHKNTASTATAPSTRPAVMEGLPMLETYEDAVREKSQQQQQGQGQAHSTSNLQARKASTTSDESPMAVQISVDSRTPHPAPTGRFPHSSPAVTPPPRARMATPPPSRSRPSPTPDPSTFLTTRKKRKSPRNPSAGSCPTTPAHDTAASSSMAVSPLCLNTQHTNIQTQRTGLFAATPFTSLMTGGRRKKASDRENTTTALWDDNNGDKVDGEDPLINGANEDAPKKVYKPVCTEDGFVCSRIKPRVQTSRVGRLAAFAAFDDSQRSDCSEGKNSEGKFGVEGSQGSAPSEPVAEILYTRLVVSAQRRREREGEGDGGEEEFDGRVQQRRLHNGSKNFKKFRKVQHVGMGAIPRLVSLEEYAPPISRQLQDWLEELENASETRQEEEEEDSSQDLFRFSATVSAGVRRRL